MALQYIPLPKSPLEMTPEEVKSYLDNQPWSLIVRSLLVYEIERMRRDGQDTEPRTLRSLWYTLIKPALSKLGALEASYYNRARVGAKGKIGKAPDWDGLMSKYLAELVRAGVTSYEELAIIDGSRLRREPLPSSLGVNFVQTVGVHYPNIILFSEKDTIYPEIENIARLYGVSVLSGGGKPSFAATENLVKEMARHERFATSGKVYVLSLTDYDPSGYEIAEAVVKQVSEVAGKLRPASKVYYQRLGLTPDQLTAAELEQNSYTPAPSGLADWTKRTGGIGGRPLGLELDALPLSRIRALFVAGLQSIIESEAVYHRDLARALVDLLIWETLEPEIRRKREALHLAIEGDVLADSLTCDPQAIARFALAGESYIDPVSDDGALFRAADSIRAKLSQAAHTLPPMR